MHAMRRSNHIPWNKLLKAVGCDSYTQYLATPHWAEFKAHYLSRPEHRICKICGASPVDIHHKRYHHLGRECFGDAVALCRLHHGQVHLLWKSSKQGLNRFTKEFVASSLGSSPRSQPGATILTLEGAKIGCRLSGHRLRNRQPEPSRSAYSEAPRLPKRQLASSEKPT